ncbi:hypothetical protein HII31_06858, partial [Pseudocercospora fuligena]
FFVVEGHTKMVELKGIHWVAPVTMLATFLVGFAFVLGHHFFYANLSGQDVPTEPYHVAGWRLSHQQFNTSVGTAFAFLVRTFLSIAMSAAYIQLLWNQVKKARARLTLGELDWAGDVRSNIVAFFNFKKGIRFPYLLAFATLCWCVPICTIFPPATIAVVSIPVIRSSMEEVPKFDFASLKYDGSLINQYEAFWDWSGPSVRVATTVQSVMGSGQMLPIAAPAPNSSWSLNMSIPALECSDVAGKARDAIFANIWNSYYGSSRNQPYTFLSWVPDSQSGLPFVARSVNGSYQGDASGPPAGLLAMRFPASLYVAVMPGMGSFYPSIGGWTFSTTGMSGQCDNQKNITTIMQPFSCLGQNGTNTTFTPAQIFNTSTLIKCNLVEASYTATFNYSAGAQNITMIADSARTPVAITPLSTFSGPYGSASGAYRQGTDGVEGVDPMLYGQPNCTAVNAQSGTYGYNPCIFDVAVLRSLSYQSIAQAFNGEVVGGMVGSSANSSILSTVLAESDEIASAWSAANNAPDSSLVTGGIISFGNTDLQTLLADNASASFQSLTGNARPISRGKLKDNLAQLFQNVTLSLLADPYFQPNYSSPFAPSRLTNVTIADPIRTVYHYNALTLWVAYGIALGFAAVALIVAFVVMCFEGVSYSNVYSTLIRVARTADLSEDVHPEDGSGSDPLPEYLERARLEVTSTARADRNRSARPEEQKLATSDEAELRPYEGS